MATSWILYIMLFTTPAQTISDEADKRCLAKSKVSQIEVILKCRRVFETRHVWSLQTTSQINLLSAESCIRRQDELITSSNVASTMTMRTWCFCESSDRACPNAEAFKETLKDVRACEIDARSSACVAYTERLSRKEFWNAPPAPPDGESSFSYQLFPPP